MNLRWRRSRTLTLCLLLLWFVLTIATCIFADALNGWSFLGFPLGFYFAAQGVLLIYLLIVAIYAYGMNRIDAPTKVKDSDSAEPEPRIARQ